MQKLRAEIIDTVGLGRSPNYHDLRSMRYLQSTIKETLRLYPAIPFNVRVALRDTSLPRAGGPKCDRPVGIIKNTVVAYSALAMQRREALYSCGSQALEYDPDRWLNWQPRPWCYIPFNGGPRICVGQQFAITEIGYTVVRLLQQFGDIRGSVDQKDGDPHLKADIVLQPVNGVKLAFS